MDTEPAVLKLTVIVERADGETLTITVPRPHDVSLSMIPPEPALPLDGDPFLLAGMGREPADGTLTWKHSLSPSDFATLDVRVSSPTSAHA